MYKSRNWLWAVGAMSSVCACLAACGGDSSFDTARGGTGGGSMGGSSGTAGAAGGSGAGGGSIGGSSGAPTPPPTGTVVVSPKSVVLEPGQTQTFTCTVAGTPQATCTWSVKQSGGGTITSAGVYTAPNTEGTYQVVGTDSSDSSKTDSATILVKRTAVSACDALGGVGAWQQVTPSAVNTTKCQYGATAAAVDPQNPATVYLATCNQGIFKSPDCGTSWSKINTGTLGDWMEAGTQWFFILDPLDTQVIYSNSGYNALNGNHSGAFKSTNGGVDWKEIWPPADGSYADLVTNNFVGQMSMDPTNHLHLLIGFHQVCAAPHTQVCYAETRDGGDTWTIHDADPRWGNSEGQHPRMMSDQNWLFGNHDTLASTWVTTDGGAHWNPIGQGTAGHLPGQLYHATSGWYYGTDSGIIFSADGASWSLLPNSGQLVTGLAGDGTTMWAAYFGWVSAYAPPGTNVYYTSPESDGKTWVNTSWPVPAGAFTSGGALSYDPVHHVLYSVNYPEGFWRVVVK